MGRTYIFNQRKINLEKYYLQNKECEKYSNWKNSAANKCPPFDRSTISGLANSSKSHINTVSNKQRANEYCEKIPETYDRIYEKSKFINDRFPTSIVDTKNDLRSSENIFNEWKDIHCKMLSLSKKIRSKIFVDPILSKVSHFKYYLNNFNNIEIYDF